MTDDTQQPVQASDTSVLTEPAAPDAPPPKVAVTEAVIPVPEPLPVLKTIEVAPTLPVAAPHDSLPPQPASSPKRHALRATFRALGWTLVKVGVPVATVLWWTTRKVGVPVAIAGTLAGTFVHGMDPAINAAYVSYDAISASIEKPPGNFLNAWWTGIKSAAKNSSEFYNLDP